MTVRHGGGAHRTGVLASLLLSLAISLCGCGSAERPLPLAHTLQSPLALSREVMAAIARNDRARLDELALSEEEFRTVVWPRLPSSRPEVGLPIDYAWGDLHAKSAGYLSATLASFAGQHFELIDVQFRGETTDYERFRVHRTSVLEVRGESGETTRVRMFGSMIELDGRVKVFSYVVD
jgi:hypothetical protein